MSALLRPMTAALDFDQIDQVAPKVGIHDVPCPLCCASLLARRAPSGSSECGMITNAASPQITSPNSRTVHANSGQGLLQ